MSLPKLNSSLLKLKKLSKWPTTREVIANGREDVDEALQRDLETALTLSWKHRLDTVDGNSDGESSIFGTALSRYIKNFGTDSDHHEDENSDEDDDEEIGRCV